MAAAVRLNVKGLEEAVARANKLNGATVAIGFQSGGASYEGVTALDVAIYNEFGTQRAPARPFMAQTMAENEARVREACRRIGAAAQQPGANQRQLLGTLGEFYQGLIRRQITSGSYAPNAPATVKAKGSSKPLVDTGRVLIPNVRYVIR